MKQKVDYLFSSIRKQITREGFACPSCGSSKSTLVARKYLVTALRRCERCQLLFRVPTTPPEENQRFYQEDYQQGFTTDCPADERLGEYLENSFMGEEKDYSVYIDVIFAAGGKNGDRLFDFGCSWGYGSWQLAQKGFEVESYEISVSRASFARNKLGIKVHSSLSNVKGSFDIFFSSHVLEHVPSVRDSIDFGMRILKPGGLFISFTPNGSEEFRRANPGIWNKWWGLVHPNFLDEKFFRRTFSDQPLFVSSNPYDLEKISEWSTDSAVEIHGTPLGGGELLVLIRK